MIEHTLKHGKELHSIIIEGIQPNRKPKTKYISQVIKDAGATSCRKLKDMANARAK